MANEKKEKKETQPVSDTYGQPTHEFASVQIRMTNKLTPQKSTGKHFQLDGCCIFQGF